MGVTQEEFLFVECGEDGKSLGTRKSSRQHVMHNVLKRYPRPVNKKKAKKCLMPGDLSTQNGDQEPNEERQVVNLCPSINSTGPIIDDDGIDLAKVAQWYFATPFDEPLTGAYRHVMSRFVLRPWQIAQKNELVRHGIIAASLKKRGVLTGTSSKTAYHTHKDRLLSGVRQ